MSAPDLSVYGVRVEDVTVAVLEGETAFKGLTAKEARYALQISRAAWAGHPICAFQTSAISVPLLALIRTIFSTGYDDTKAKLEGVAGVHWEAFVAYCISVIDNSGNYKSFGDTLLVPTFPVETFAALVTSSPAYSTHGGVMDELWAWVKGPAYDLRPRNRQLGLGKEQGVSTYYSSDVTEEEAKVAHKYLASIGYPQAYHSRTFGVGEGAERVLEVRLASALTTGEPDLGGPGVATAVFEGRHIRVVRGDYGAVMARVCKELEAAVAYAANDTQAAMLAAYIASFSTGSMHDHIKGSALWVKDKGPAVESYIGFIESYQDPLGVSGAWEGFCAVVNKETSKKFTTLVDGAASLLTLLPWGKLYEKDTFSRPDFTALDVLAFASGGIPAGINIPNYDSVRQTVGFKNVSLANVLSARDSKSKVSFLGDADQALFSALIGHSFEVQVGLHELLGHGSGKVFVEDAAGVRNFDAATTPDFLGVTPLTTWYKGGATWDTSFGSSASAMEECRAEAVGIYLCSQASVLDIFGHPAPNPADTTSSDIVYINWLNMARAGLLALQYYNPATSTHGQAHMQARYALLRVMLEVGGGFVEIHGGGESLSAAAVAAKGVEEGQGGVYITLDRTKILSHGMPAVGAFLSKLQVIKSTADVERGVAWFKGYTNVPTSYLPLRDLVIQKRKPRQAFVQPLLEGVGEVGTGGLGSIVSGGEGNKEVVMRVFPSTVAGHLDSFVSRVPLMDGEVLDLWRKERSFHAVA